MTEMTTMKSLRVSLRVIGQAAVAAFLFSACSNPVSRTDEPASIVSFAAEPARVAAGGKSVLSWRVTGDVRRVELLSGVDTLVEYAGVDGEFEVESVDEGRTRFVLVAYGKGGDSARADVEVVGVSAPEVTSFAASRNEVPAGGAVVLSWRTLLGEEAVLRAGDLEIARFSGAQVAVGEYAVRPDADTEYRLDVTGLAGEASATVFVKVNDAPVFAQAEASPQTLLRGETTTLSWTTKRADSIAIKEGARTLETIVGDDVAAGSRDFVIERSRTFTLVATGPGGAESATLPVTVSLPARVESFLAVPPEIVVGSTVALSWSVAEADELTLLANGVEVELESAGLPTGSVTVSPTESTNYSLRVSGPGGESTADLFVVVHGVPVIELFDANPRETFRRRGPAVLSWVTTGASAVSVSTSTGEIVDLEGGSAAAGSVELYPHDDTVYVLSALGPGGVAESEPVAVTVSEPAPLIALSLLRDPINRGMTSELSWSITDADTFTVEESVDGGASFASVDVTEKSFIDAIPTTPTAVTLYRVRATNAHGTSEELITQRVVNPPAVTHFDVPNVPGSGTHAVHVTMDEPFDVEWVATDSDGVLFDPPTAFSADTEPFVSIVDREGTEDLPVPTGTSGFHNFEFPDNFRFPFFNADYASARMVVPGYLCFGDDCGSSASTIGQNIPSPTAPNGVIAPFWDGLKTVAGTTRWLYRVDGVVPSRRLTIEWHKMDFSSSSNDGEELTFQVVLHESGLWEIRNAPRAIGSKNPNNNVRWGTNATIGVESPGGTSALANYRNASALCSQYTAGSSAAGPGSCTPITRLRPQLLPATGSRQMTLTPPSYTNNTRTLYLRAFGPLGAVRSQEIVVNVNRKPINVELTASKAHLGAGEKLKLSWTGTLNPAMDFDRVEIVDGDGELLPLPNPKAISGINFGSEFEFVPTKGTTYRLVAYNKAQFAVESDPVEVVLGAPTLAGATVSPAAGAMNDSYTFSWTTLTGASSIRLVAPDESVVFSQTPPAGSVKSITRTDLVLPGEYQLIASNSSGDGTPARLNIAIETGTKLIHFVADTDEQTTGKPVTLGWESYNGTELKIFANGSEVHSSNDPSDIRGPTSQTLTMGAVDTTYRLEVTGASGTVASEVVVRAAPTPRVTELITEPSTPNWNEPFKLKWKTQNATNVRVQKILTAAGPNAGGMPTEQVVVVADYPVGEAQFAQGEITLTVDRAATFRALAENRVGDEHELRLTRDPRRQSPSLSFDVAPASGTPNGGYSELSWSASQVDGVKLYEREADERLQVPYEFVPHGFVDISSTGQELTLELSNGTYNYVAGYATVPFPDAFRPPYFGEPMAGMLVSARGMVTLGPNPNNLTLNGCVNPVPSGEASSFGCASFTPGKDGEFPNAFVAPFNNTLSACYQSTSATATSGRTCVNRVGGAPDEPGKVFFELRGDAPHRVAIVQWNNWDFASASYKGTLTFQAKIYENGDTEFQYKRLYSTNPQRAGGDQGILGVESPDGTQFVWLDERTGNDPLVFDGDGYRFYTGLQPLQRPTSNPLKSRFIVPSNATAVNYRASVQTPASNAPSVEKTHAILPGTFTFSELMIDPGTTPELGSEWIEIRNRGARANLKGYTLTTASSMATPYTFTEDLVVEKDAVVLVAQGATPFGVGSATVSAVYGEGVRMHNVQDTVILRYGDVLIDRVDYDKTGGWTIPKGRSLALDPRGSLARHNDTPSMWCPGRQDSTGNVVGSPGAVNDPCLKWVEDVGGYDPDADIETLTGAAPAFRVITGYSNSLANQAYDVPIGFDFPHFGERYSTVNVAALGFVAFGDFHTSGTTVPTPLSSTTMPTSLTYGGSNMIAPLYAALRLLNSASHERPSAVYAMTQGEAPNRRFVVQWASYALTSGTSYPVDFSLVLGEQGEIEFHYKELTLSTTSGVVGMQAWGNEVGFPAFKGPVNGTNSADTDLKQLPAPGSSIKLVRH